MFSHGSIKSRAENVQRHRFNIQALHSLLGNQLAGKMEILRAPIDHNSTTYQRILTAGTQTLMAMPPPRAIQTLTGIGDTSHWDWCTIVYNEGDWRHGVQLKPEFAALAAAGSLTGLLAMRAYKNIQAFLIRVMGDNRLPREEAFVYDGCLTHTLVKEAQS